MNLIKYLLFFIGDIILIGCPLSYIYRALWSPANFVLFNTPKNYWPNNKPDIITVAYLTATFVGFATIIYNGTEFLFSWMPHSWGSYNEDNEFDMLSQTLAGWCAMSGSFALVTGLSQAAHSRYDAECKHEAMQHSFDHIQDCISTLRYTDHTKLHDRLQMLESKLTETQGRHFMYSRFKDNPLPFTSVHGEARLRKLYYFIDIEPCLSLIQLIRAAFGLTATGR
jgi:hypothetical protein